LFKIDKEVGSTIVVAGPAGGHLAADLCCLDGAMAFDQWRRRPIMRVVWVLSLFLLAGCFSPEEETKPVELEIWGSCPQWVTNAHKLIGTLEINGTNSTIFDFNMTAMDGNALDLYVVSVNTTGAGTLRFFAGSQQLQVSMPDAATPFRPSLPVTDGHVQVQLFLSPVTHGSAPAPGPLTVRGGGSATIELIVQPWFRVCGEA
jgi:hypothetical protein